ncbi:HAD family hydrolase [bacterium]|nr:HAD family hydrolase [bacterium]
MKNKAVIFDMDGTLLNTLQDIGEAANKALIANGLPQHPLEKYNYFVGEGVRKLFEYALPPDITDHKILEKCIDSFVEEYDKQWNNNTQLYPGISGMLDKLTELGIKLSILSNKPHEFVTQCADLYLKKWKFEEVMGPGELIPRKPDPAGALLIAKRMNISVSEILYVGDTGIDMVTANSAKMRAIGVLWGFRSKEELLGTGARFVIEKPEQLIEYL